MMSVSSELESPLNTLIPPLTLSIINFFFSGDGDDEGEGEAATACAGVFDEGAYQMDPSKKGNSAGVDGGVRVSATSSWCVAVENVDKEILQKGLDYACGEGGTDCGPIQPKVACYLENIVVIVITRSRTNQVYPLLPLFVYMFMVVNLVFTMYGKYVLPVK